MAANLNSLLVPLSDEQEDNIQQFAAELSTEQLLWTSGYLAGMAATPRPFAIPTPVTADTQTAQTITVLFGSETGNSQSIAEALAETLSQQGSQVNVKNLRDYHSSRLKKETHLILVVATHGEGDPPDDAEEFYDYVMGKRAPDLSNLNFAVLALGDSSYAHYCETGRKLDQRLSELGANRLHPRVDCDVDFQSSAQSWADEITQSLRLPAATVGTVIPLRRETASYSKDKPFPAQLLLSQKITGRDSEKDVRHVELSLEGSGLFFEPGDSLAVIPQNSTELVESTLATLNVSGEETVLVDGTTKTLSKALAGDLELSNLSLGFLESYANLSESRELITLLSQENAQDRATLFRTHQIIDVLRKYPATTNPQEIVNAFQALSPRLYSIASSPDVFSDEVHLTVDVIRYSAFETEHHGVASRFLSPSEDVGLTVPAYVDRNPRFRLPEDPDAPVIMIGPGTGVAPFRSFIQHREALGAKGRNWLFFGAQHFDSDFLYQLEWLRYRKQGLLTHLDAAFSRDQHQKIYVQHLMKKKSRELFQWLEEGAYIYVCGDATQMANDVNQALLDIVATEKHQDLDFSRNYLKTLRQQGRYQKDVY